MKFKDRKVIAIVGPTACGKTGIGVRLAKEFKGEIVSADSRQVYRGLDIGTGKDLKEYDNVKYHMIDIVDPCPQITPEVDGLNYLRGDRTNAGCKFALFDYLPLARLAIKDILGRGKLPIIVGGTGLYVQGLVEGFELEPTKRVILSRVKNPRDPSVTPQDDNKKYSREQLDKFTIKQLNHILQGADPEKFRTVDKKNRHRLIRAIELAQAGLQPTKKKPDFEVLQIGIDIPRKELHERIDQRVDERFERGMLDEVEGLLKQGVDPEWLIGLGLEYKVIASYLLECHFDSTKSVEKSFDSHMLAQDGVSKRKISRQTRDDKGDEFDAMSQDLKWKIHQFARRQMTWFRRFPEINWLLDYKEIKRFVKIFLEH